MSKPNVAALIESQKKQIALALPKHMTADRMARIALTEVRKNPALGLCEPTSFLGAIIQCAQLGLEPGNGLGHVYLVPFQNRKKGFTEVQIIPGYRGLIDLARRSGQIISISARTVHENDEFEFEYGLDEKLVHRPAKDERGEIIGAYAVAKLKDGGQQFEFMTKNQIDKVSTGSDVWKKHYEEMARKTVVRRLVKYLPMSIELANLVELSDREETKLSQENEQILIDVGFEPPVIENATPIEIDKQASKQAKGESTEQLHSIIMAEIKKMKAKGVSEESILKDLMLDNLDQLNGMSKESLEAVVDALGFW